MVPERTRDFTLDLTLPHVTRPPRVVGDLSHDTSPLFPCFFDPFTSSAQLFDRLFSGTLTVLYFPFSL